MCVYFQMIHYNFYIANYKESALLLLSRFYTGCGGDWALMEYTRKGAISTLRLRSPKWQCHLRTSVLVGFLSTWRKLKLSEVNLSWENLYQIACREIFLSIFLINDWCRWALRLQGTMVLLGLWPWVVEESKRAVHGEKASRQHSCGLCPDPPSKFLPNFLTVMDCLISESVGRKKSFSSLSCFWSWHLLQQKKFKTTSFNQNILVVSPNKSPLMLLVNVTSLFKHKIQVLYMLTAILQSDSECFLRCFHV